MRSLKLLGLFLLTPLLLVAQAPKKKLHGLKARIASVNAQADSSGFRFELGSDMVTTQSGDSMPADVRAGVVVSQAATVEATVSAKSNEGYTEYEAALGPTLAIFPGATAFHGQYISAAVVYHNDGLAHQFGIRIGTGNREIAVSGISARIQGFTERLFANGTVPADTRVGAMVGISIWR